MRSIALLSVLLVGCVTSADIRELSESQAQYEARVNQTLDRLRDGSIDEDEAKRLISEERRELERLQDEKAQEVADRTEDAIEGVKGLIEGTATQGGIAGTLGLVGMYLLRNYTRRREIEKKVSQAAPAAPPPPHTQVDPELEEAIRAAARAALDAQRGRLS